MLSEIRAYIIIKLIFKYLPDERKLKLIIYNKKIKFKYGL